MMQTTLLRNEKISFRKAAAFYLFVCLFILQEKNSNQQQMESLLFTSSVQQRWHKQIVSIEIQIISIWTHIKQMFLSTFFILSIA